VSGCCSDASDCGDDDPCTKDSCVNNACSYTPDVGPECCEEITLLSTGFDDGTTGGFTLIKDGSAAFWSVQENRFFSPTSSLYFGVPGEWTTEVDGSASGTARSSTFDVPLASEAVTLTFRTWYDILSFGGGGFGDTYILQVLANDTLETVWTRSGSQANQETWLEIEVDLSAYKGQKVQLYWVFEGINTPFGSSGEGAYLDDVSVTTSCGD
jgi:hypothetical protein